MGISLLNHNGNLNFTITIKKRLDDINSFSVKFLRHVRAIIPPVLCYLINESLNCYWNISRLFKYCKSYSHLHEGYRSTVSNYKPISVLPTLSKIHEKVAYK